MYPVPLRAGRRAELQLPGGHVCAALVPLELDRRNRSASYELRVVNETEEALASRAYVVGGRRGREAIAWVELAVPARSTVALEMEIPTPASGTFERALVELDGPRTHLTLIAPPPRPRGNPFVVGLVASAVSVALTALLAFAGSWWLGERSRMLALETRVAALGAQVQNLAARTRAPAPQMPPKPAPQAEIVALSARRVDGPAGQRLVADYRLVGDRGTLRLADAKGHVLAEAPFDRAGHTVLGVSRTASTADLTLTLAVARGTSHTRAAIDVPPPAEEEAVRAHQPPASALFTIVSHVIRGGRTLRVAVLRNEPDLHLALTDDAGKEIDGVDVVAGQPNVTLRVPDVAEPTRFTIVASYARGEGEEAVIAPLNVLPAQ